MKLIEIDTSIQELSIGNQKCDNADDDDVVMIPMCRPCFAGDTQKDTNDIQTKEGFG